MVGVSLYFVTEGKYPSKNQNDHHNKGDGFRDGHNRNPTAFYVIDSAGTHDA